MTPPLLASAWRWKIALPAIQSPGEAGRGEASIRVDAAVPGQPAPSSLVATGANSTMQSTATLPAARAQLETGAGGDFPRVKCKMMGEGSSADAEAKITSRPTQPTSRCR